MQLKNAIKETGLTSESMVYIHHRSKIGDTQQYKVADIPPKDLKEQVDIIQYGHGDRECGFNHYLFVLKK